MRGSLVVALAFIGCGGGGKGGGLGPAAATVAQLQPLCDARCQRDLTCGETTDLTNCVTTCVEQGAGWIRGDAAFEILTCEAMQPCATTTDQCLGGIDPLPIHEQWETQCRAQLATCDIDIEKACESTLDPVAETGLFTLIAEPIVRELITCLAQPDCQSRLDCVTTTLRDHGIDF